MHLVFPCWCRPHGPIHPIHLPFSGWQIVLKVACWTLIGLQIFAARAKDVIENRAAYRAMCFSTPGLSEHISGVILHWETLFQEDATGKPMVDIIKGNGMIPGIKVDKGYNKKGMWGTAVGLLGHPEVATLGLDDLQQRCAQAYKDRGIPGFKELGNRNFNSQVTPNLEGCFSHCAQSNVLDLDRQGRALQNGAMYCSWTQSRVFWPMNW